MTQQIVRSKDAHKILKNETPDRIFFSRHEVPGSPKYEVEEELWKETQVTERQSYEGADKVTVDMMDSKDVPVERSDSRQHLEML